MNDVLHKFDRLVEEDEEDAQKLSRNVYMYALACLDSFMSITLSIAENRTEIVHNANAHIMRTFLFLQQGSLIEMRNACSVLGAHFKETTVASRRPSRVDTAATVRARPSRTRPFQASPPQRNPYHTPPTVMLHSNDNSRSNTLTSISAAIPRSGETTPSMSRSNTLTGSFDEGDEEGQFDRVYAKLRSASDSCRSSMPKIAGLMKEQFENLRRELDSEHPRIKALAGLIDKSNEVYQMTIPLASHLSQMQLKDSFTRNQPDFWQQCMGFIKVGFACCTWFCQGVLTQIRSRHGKSSP